MDIICSLPSTCRLPPGWQHLNLWAFLMQVRERKDLPSAGPFSFGHCWHGNRKKRRRVKYKSLTRGAQRIESMLVHWNCPPFLAYRMCKVKLQCCKIQRRVKDQLNITACVCKRVSDKLQSHSHHLMKNKESYKNETASSFSRDAAKLIADKRTSFPRLRSAVRW